MSGPDDRGLGSDASAPRARAPRRLRCPECGETYRDRWRCRCGAPLDF
ncbi:threonine synthase, partial [Halorubrum sp. AD140]|nr:threonine synthase [Halorubrum sp. AD140]